MIIIAFKLPSHDKFMEYSFIADLAACQGLPIPRFSALLDCYLLNIPKKLVMMFYEFFICNMI